MIAELAGATVRKGIVSAGELTLQMMKHFNSCVSTVLSAELSYADVKMSSVVLTGLLAMAALRSRTPSSLGYHYRQTSLKKSLVSMVDRLPTSLPKDDGTAGELTATQRLRRRSYDRWRAGLTEIITYALTTPEKSSWVHAQPSNLTELMWPLTVDRSVLRQNMISGILIRWPTT